MTSIFILLSILTLQPKSLSAAPFVKGYYYANDGKRVEGLIKFGRATFSAFWKQTKSYKI